MIQDIAINTATAHVNYSTRHAKRSNNKRIIQNRLATHDVHTAAITVEYTAMC